MFRGYGMLNDKSRGEPGPKTTKTKQVHEYRRHIDTSTLFTKKKQCERCLFASNIKGGRRQPIRAAESGFFQKRAFWRMPTGWKLARC